MNAIVSLIPGRAAHTRQLARFGAWGFAFFAAKGLAWLIVPLLAMYFA